MSNYIQVHGGARRSGRSTCVVAYLQLTSGEVDSVASLDGDIVVHGVTEFYTKVNYHTGVAFRYRSNCWEKRTPPGERQFQVTSLLEVPPTDSYKKNQRARADSLKNALISAGIGGKVTLLNLREFAKKYPQYKPPSKLTIETRRDCRADGRRDQQ